MKFGKHTLAIVTCFYLAGCASGAQVENMLYQGEAQEYAAEIKNNVTLSSVTGGKESNPAWTYEITDGVFSSSIIQSLLNEGLYSIDGKYSLSVEMLETNKPSYSFDMTVATVVNYTLKEKSSGKVVLSKQVKAPYTATVADAFSGVERLKLANEGSGKKNIEQLMTLLSELNIDTDKVAMIN